MAEFVKEQLVEIQLNGIAELLRKNPTLEVAISSGVAEHSSLQSAVRPITSEALREVDVPGLRPDFELLTRKYDESSGKSRRVEAELATHTASLLWPDRLR